MRNWDGRMATARDKYRTLVELAPDPIFLVDMSTGEIIETNERATELLGYERQTLEGMPVTGIHPEDQTGQYLSLFEQTLARSAVRTRELADGSQLYLVTKSGERVPVELHARTVALEGSDGPWVYGIARDLSERVEHERKLRQFREAVTQTAHAVYITDTDGQIEYANPAFREISGYDKEELLGETAGIFRSSGQDGVSDGLHETLRAGEQWQQEVVHERKNGEQIVLNQTVSPLTTDDGEVEKFVTVAHDITERKTYERRLEAQRDDLSVLNSVVRHDIRNDLQVVRTRAELLADHVPEAARDHLSTLQDSVDSAIALTTTARELAEVMLQTDADPDQVAVDGVLSEALGAFRESYPDARVEVTGTVPAVDVVGDELLYSVFRNLLSNAVIHSQTTDPEITVSANLTGAEMVEVRVADDGPGVPDDRKKSIFGKGEKGLDSEGTGVGLYLVKSVVESYGGEVWVEDNQPEGAVFVVTLPEA
jgi:PAS domain S-box-containing protein